MSGGEVTAAGASGRMGSGSDPFAVLGLRANDDLGDDDVRVAWRRIAAATHPDRADGGDPDQFALAAAAYTDLRTAFGRNEARASLKDRADPGVTGAGEIGAGGAGAGGGKIGAGGVTAADAPPDPRRRLADRDRGASQERAARPADAEASHRDRGDWCGRGRGWPRFTGRTCAGRRRAYLAPGHGPPRPRRLADRL